MSSLWCNDKKLGSFTSGSSAGSTTMILGNLNSNRGDPIDGEIVFFGFYEDFAIDGLDMKNYGFNNLNFRKYIIQCIG